MIIGVLWLDWKISSCENSRQFIQIERTSEAWLRAVAGP